MLISAVQACGHTQVYTEGCIRTSTCSAHAKPKGRELLPTQFPGKGYSEDIVTGPQPECRGNCSLFLTSPKSYLLQKLKESRAVVISILELSMA